MGWPQIAAAVLMALGVGIQLALHGKPRDNHNAVIGVLSAAVWWYLLWKGGFWS